MEVIELHQQFFTDFGFEFHSSRMLFYKSFPQGQQVVFVHYTEYPDVSYLEYNLGIRINAVEQIIHQFLPTLSDYAERSITLIQTPDAIGKSIPNRFVIEDETQLAEAILAAERFFVLNGFHWLDEMIQPENLEKAFAQQKDKGFKTQNFVYNAFRGATLARFYNPKDYPILRNFYLEQIKKREMTPFTIASFLQLLDYLDKINV
ncbi:hypothetical protein D0X99_09370 [Algoriphagus lacus]|uniref:DUF4304 domain-containing protein n=1 Tax=Algoriphagus lacus TaxID=2056311 RepID=A0A418PRY8_9BACT|nr:hypothetical protein [Algoriphagus lacus]RIW15630.1 hypothetical protein D0X99_09370 [Algoriphagus lacus]